MLGCNYVYFMALGLLSHGFDMWSATWHEVAKSRCIKWPNSGNPSIFTKRGGRLINSRVARKTIRH